MAAFASVVVVISFWIFDLWGIKKVLNEANGSFQLRVQAWYAHVFFLGGKAEHKKKTSPPWGWNQSWGICRLRLFELSLGFVVWVFFLGWLVLPEFEITVCWVGHDDFVNFFGKKPEEQSRRFLSLKRLAVVEVCFNKHQMDRLVSWAVFSGNLRYFAWVFLHGKHNLPLVHRDYIYLWLHGKRVGRESEFSKLLNLDLPGPNHFIINAWISTGWFTKSLLIGNGL